MKQVMRDDVEFQKKKDAFEDDNAAIAVENDALREQLYKYYQDKESFELLRR